MAKVEKNTLLELVVNFKEFFAGKTIEEATEKAYQQKITKDDAIINIADRRFLGCKIKTVSKDNDDDKSQRNQGSNDKEKQVGESNEQTQKNDS